MELTTRNSSTIVPEPSRAQAQAQNKNKNETIIRPFRAEFVRHPRHSSPFRLPEGFPDKTPIDIEIGCGVGWHPIRYARENPDRFLIAIERTRKKFEKFARRLQRHRMQKHGSLANLLPMHANAIAWITHCLHDVQISRCIILYPNPNPRNPNQRWIRMPFMEHLLTRLTPNGVIHIATNETFYAEEIQDFAMRVWDLSVSEVLRFSKNDAPAGYPRTHFERKYLEREETCFEIVLRKKSY